jgi:hypothetical protein
MTISTGRDTILECEADSPSLKSKLSEIVAESYLRARKEASGETDLPLSTFPETCPWTLDQIRDPDFLPA